MFCIDKLYFSMVSLPVDYEWDEEKNQKNIEKHGINFTDAQYVLADKFRRIAYDDKHSLTEHRWKVIGNIGKILVVYITQRDKKIRIISARKATAQERKIYYGNR